MLNTRAYPQMIVTQLSQNSTNNTSTLRVTYRVQRPNTAWYVKGYYDHTPYAGGSLGFRSQWVNFAQYGNSVETVLTYDFTVNHNADGTGSVNVRWIGDLGTGWGTHDFNADVTLNTITRATTSSTQAASSVTSSSATANGTVTDVGIPVATDKGIYWGTSTGNLPNKISTGSGGAGAFTVDMSGLSAGTTYYYKAFSQNSGGYGYGSEVNFTTSAVAPTVTTQAASSVTYNSATGNGNITATGGASVTRRGFCYKTGTSGDPTTSDSVAYDDGTFGTGAYTKAITGLSASTGYRVRAYCVNSAGTSYGETVQVTTQSATAPIVSSVEASKIYKTSAIIGGNVSASDTTVSERGIYWGTTEGTQATKVASTSGTGTFSIHLTGLDEDTTYYFKAFGTNIGGTGYGDILHFKTAKFHSSVGDRDSLPSFELS